MSDNEIIVINFLTKIDNTKFISVPENNQEHLSNFIGEKVLLPFVKEIQKIPSLKIEKMKIRNKLNLVKTLKKFS
jgi:hypothetical protein